MVVSYVVVGYVIVMYASILVYYSVMGVGLIV